jgi:mRNA interferase MazF
MTAPARGEVWLADLDPVRGREQAGRRPVLVVSDDVFNRSPAGLVIVVPITSRLRAIPSHVRIPAADGGLRTDSAAICEAVRSIARERLVARGGAVRAAVLDRVEDILRVLLRL